VEWNLKAGQNPARVVAPIEEEEDLVGSYSSVNVALLIFEGGFKSIVLLLQYPIGKKGEFY